MSAPTWQELRNNRWMVVDQDSLLLAVYPTDSGAVAVAFGHPQQEKIDGFRIDPADVPLLQKQLQCACDFAQQQRQSNLETTAVKLAFDVIERVKGGA